MSSSIELNRPFPEPVAPSPTTRVPLPVHRPLWTPVLLAINVLVWLTMSLLGGTENPAVLVLFGAKYNPLIAAGQYWRLITANFIHIGLMHLLFNTYALFSFGTAVERRFGRSRFLVLYLLSGLTGSVLSFLGNRALAAGASGAIFGLLGATIVYFATYRQEFGQGGRRQLTNLLLVAGYNLAWGFIAPGIDNLGHIGGLLAGLALGWALCPRYHLVYADVPVSYRLIDRYQRMRAWFVSAVVVAVIVALTSWGVHVQG